MYGYIVVNQPELKFKEYDIYRSYYCGLCDALRDAAGLKGQMTLSYDMTFLVMFLSGLYEPETTFALERCVAHPARKHPVRRNEVTDYVADMNILLAYYKCLDDWNDEKKITKLTFAKTLAGKVKGIERKFPEKARLIKECLDNLSELEKKEEPNIDKPAAEFGRLLGEILVMKEDEWADSLRRIGNSLGRFIYLIDAYDDLDKDIKTGNYNVFKYHDKGDAFDEFCENILRTYMAGCAREFEMLPILDNAEILRNIIYSGVWTKFDIAKNRRNKKVED